MYIGTIAIQSDASLDWLLLTGCLVGLAATLVVRLSYRLYRVRQSTYRRGSQTTIARARTTQTAMIIGTICCLFVASVTILAHSGTSRLSITDKLQESLFEAGFDNPSVSPGTTEFVGTVKSAPVKGHLVKRRDGVYDVYVDSPSKTLTTARA